MLGQFGLAGAPHLERLALAHLAVGAELRLRRGVDIDYVGYAGPYALDTDGDPGAARYLVRVFGTNNKPGAAARPVRYP